MKIVNDIIELSTQGFTDIINITPDLAGLLKNSKLKQGIAVLTIIGSTGGLTTMEYEPGLIKDIKEELEKMFPYKKDYAHHRTWGCDNGAAHLRSAFTGTSLTVSFNNSSLQLGTWQQVVLLDYDTTSRHRKISVQMLGE